jgi:hypothetical protein
MRKVDPFRVFLPSLPRTDTFIAFNPFSDQALQVSLCVQHQNGANEDDTIPEGRGPADEAEVRFPDACIICNPWLIFGETIEDLYHRIYLQ